MPVRKPSTERQRRLGAELRRMREQAGLSVTEAAALHRVDKTTLSNTESARFGVSADRVRVWAANYRCPDQKYVDALADMARERGSHWWDEYRNSFAAPLLDLAELEHHAHALHHVQIMYLPGLLQDEDYARAVFQEAIPPLVPEAVDQMVEFRQRRRRILDRENPPECMFAIHETALRAQLGTSAATRRQLQGLLQESERENVTIRVMPFPSGGFFSIGSATLYACGPVSQLDTVQVDVPGSLNFLSAETELVNYRTAVDRLEHRSLGPDRSRDFISAMVREL